MFNRILVVDDSRVSRLVIKKYLEIIGSGQFAVLEAENGREALSLIDQTAVDLVITDMHMPGMSGFELIERLKAAPKTERIPVMVMSGVIDRNNRQRFMKSGASVALTKPIACEPFHKAIFSLGAQEP